MTKFSKLTILVSSLALSSAVFAGQEVTTMDITASVDAACSVSSAGADFGAVVPGNGDTASGTVDVNCSSGAAYSVALDAGQNPQDGGTVRSMLSGSDPIRYTILKGSGTGGAGQPWGDAGAGNTFPGGTVVTQSGTGAVQSLGMNLAVVGESQNTYTPGGNYSDTVQITVNF